MKKVLIVGLCVLTLGLAVGCTDSKEEVNNDESIKNEISEEDKKASDEITVALISEAINEKLSKQNTIVNEDSSGELNEVDLDLANISERENEKLEILLGKIYDEGLVNNLKEYIKGNNLRVQYLREREDNYMEVMDYSIESMVLISQSICNMVDGYGLVINEEHSEFYNSCREKVEELEKEEAGRKALEELFNAGDFEKTLEEGEFYKTIHNVDEVFKYSKTIENTTGISFDYIVVMIKGELENGEFETVHNQLIDFPMGKIDKLEVISPNNYKSIEVSVESATLR